MIHCCDTEQVARPRKKLIITGAAEVKCQDISLESLSVIDVIAFANKESAVLLI